MHLSGLMGEKKKGARILCISRVFIGVCSTMSILYLILA